MKVFIVALLYVCSRAVLSSPPFKRILETNGCIQSIHEAFIKLKNAKKAELDLKIPGVSFNNNAHLRTSSSSEDPLKFTLPSNITTSKPKEFGRPERWPTVIGVTAMQLRNLETRRRKAKERIPKQSKHDISFLSSNGKGETITLKSDEEQTHKTAAVMVTMPTTSPLEERNKTALHSLNFQRFVKPSVQTSQGGLRIGNFTLSKGGRLANHSRKVEKFTVENAKAHERVRREDKPFSDHFRKNINLKRKSEISKEFGIADNEEIANLERQQGPKAVILSGKLTSRKPSVAKGVYMLNRKIPKLNVSQQDNYKAFSTTVGTSFMVKEEPRNVHYLINNAGKPRAPPVIFKVNGERHRFRSGRLQSSPSPAKFKEAGHPQPKWESILITNHAHPSAKESDVPTYKEAGDYSKEEREIKSWLESLPIPEEGRLYFPYPVYMNYQQSYQNAYPNRLMSLQSGHSSRIHQHSPLCTHHRGKQGVGVVSGTRNHQQVLPAPFYHIKNCCREGATGSFSRWRPGHYGSSTNWPFSYVR